MHEGHINSSGRLNRSIPDNELRLSLISIEREKEREMWFKNRDARWCGNTFPGEFADPFYPFKIKDVSDSKRTIRYPYRQIGKEREMFFDISPNSKVAERGEWNGWNSGEIRSFYLAALHVCEFARWDERKLLPRTVPRPKATMHA